MLISDAGARGVPFLAQSIGGFNQQIDLVPLGGFID